MTGPVDVTPHELREFARRVDGRVESVRACSPDQALIGVRSHLPVSWIAGAANALGERMGPSVSRLADHLDGIADQTRHATDVLVDTDAANAASLGGR